MEGYKFEIETPEGQVVPHWDEAKNIEYNNNNSNLASTNVQSAIDELAASQHSPSVSGGSNIYYVDLEKYGITEGYINKTYIEPTEQIPNPPEYTDTDYDIMYNNGIGFSRAFYDAKQAGYDIVKIPEGEYCLTPVYAYDGALSVSENTNNPITINSHGNADGNDARIKLNASIYLINTSNLTIDFGGSTFYMILDSYNKSVYYNISNRAVSDNTKLIPYSYALMRVIQCDNIVLKNGVFKGDKYVRKFSYAAAEGQSTTEGGYGIEAQGRDSHDILFENLEGSGFCADFIGFGSRSQRTYLSPVWYGDNKCYVPTRTTAGNGGIGTNINIEGIKNVGYKYTDAFSDTKKHFIETKSATGCALSKIYEISKGYNNTASDWIKKERGKRRYSISHNLGNTRIPNCYCPSIEILTYNKTEDSQLVGPIRIIPCGYLESFVLLENETHIQLQFKYEFGLASGQGRGVVPNNILDIDDSGEDDSGDDSGSDEVDDTESTGNDTQAGGPQIHIINGLMYNIRVNRCYVHDNGRGGIVPAGSNVIIENCTFGKRDKAINGKPVHPSNFGTSSAQYIDTYPEWWGGTNYHINCEDHFPANMTIRNCSFYGSAIMMPTILRLDMYNNVLHGTTGPSIKNAFHVYMGHNTFAEGGSVTSLSYRPNFGATISKQHIIKHVISDGNTYFDQTGQNAGDHKYVKGLITNCNIVIKYKRLESNVDPLINETEPTDLTYSNCHIKCVNGATGDISNANVGQPFYNILSNSVLASGHIAIGELRNCIIESAAIYIVPSNKNVDGNGVFHCYITDTKVIKNPFNILFYKFSAEKEIRDIVVHYTNCTIDFTNIPASIFSGFINTQTSGPAVFAFAYTSQSTGKITYEFNNCKIISTAYPTTTIRRPDYDLVQYLTYKADTVSGKYVLKIGDDSQQLIGDSVYLKGVIKSGIDYSVELSSDLVTAIGDALDVTTGTYTKSDIQTLAGSTNTTEELAVLNTILQQQNNDEYIPVLFRIKSPRSVALYFNNCDFDLYAESDVSYLFNDFDTSKGIAYDAAVTATEQTNKLVSTRDTTPKVPEFKLVVDNCTSSSKLIFTKNRTNPVLSIDDVTDLDTLILCSNDAEDLEYFTKQKAIHYDDSVDKLYIRVNDNTNICDVPEFKEISLNV